MSLLSKIATTLMGEFLGGVLVGAVKGAIAALTADSREQKERAENIKTNLKAQGYDPDKMLFKFDAVSKFIFMTGKAFYGQLSTFDIVFEIVDIFDEFGHRLDMRSLAVAPEDIYGGSDEGPIGDDGEDDISGWGDELDSGGFGGW